ncbi:uncharacterized protein LOC107265814 [Cephus cinctus]|uniref:Uncharacterized protein LOC107265814 n=1 Tax=Cephus cinctus TaxID=211228 RepID=A0AAJ7BPI4_CEPCN|nr:uncharacterized protein LOC107265814 [Cephus cinctus]
MFRYRWFHRIIRRNTKPISEEKALLWKKRLNLVYIFVTWNTVGLLLLKWSNSDTKEISSAKSFAKLLNIEEAQVIRVSGLKVVDNYEIEKPISSIDIKKESEDLFFNTDDVLKKLDSQESEVIVAKK